MVDGVLEIEGSEAFVASQLDRFDSFIRSAPEAQRGSSGAMPKQTDSTTADKGSPAPSGLDEVFAVAGDTVQILKDIPGDSKPSRTVNAARLLLYGMKALKDTETVLFEDVKKVCKSHGFYDSTNMAKFLKADQTSFIFGGSGKKQSLQLTVPGSKATAKIIEQLQAGSGEAE